MGLKDPRAHSHCLGGSRKVFQRRRHKLSVKEYILIQHVGKKVQMLRVCRVGGGGGAGEGGLGPGKERDPVGEDGPGSLPT